MIANSVWNGYTLRIKAKIIWNIKCFWNWFFKPRRLKLVNLFNHVQYSCAYILCCHKNSMTHNSMTPMCKFGGLSEFWNTGRNGVQRYLEPFVITLRQAISNDLSFFYTFFVFSVLYHFLYNKVLVDWDALWRSKGDFSTRGIARVMAISLWTYNLWRCTNQQKGT